MALTSSPLGLASYILEKMATFASSDSNLMASDGNLPSMFTLDEMLDNIMVYWLTGTITSSMRFYKENIGRVENKPHVDAYAMYVNMSCF